MVGVLVAAARDFVVEERVSGLECSIIGSEIIFLGVVNFVVDAFWREGFEDEDVCGEEGRASEET